MRLLVHGVEGVEVAELHPGFLELFGHFLVVLDGVVLVDVVVLEGLHEDEEEDVEHGVLHDDEEEEEEQGVVG